MVGCSGRVAVTTESRSFDIMQESEMVCLAVSSSMPYLLAMVA